MSNLADGHAVPTKAGEQPLTDDETRSLLKQVPNWQIEYASDRSLFVLARSFEFDSYTKVLDFHSKVGELAEAEQHHPEMTTQYGSVKVCWWTHTVGGVHMNDFVLAAKCDVLFARMN